MNKEQEQQIEEVLTRGVAEVIDKTNLKKRLLSGEKLRIKLGIDPTSPNIHIGRSIPLLKLKDLQDLGHQVVLIIGNFTGVIGDTSDKESERPMLTEEQVENNLKNYKEQAGKILDMSKVEFHFNSEWLSKLTYKEIGRQADIFSLAEFNARENIRKRLDEGTRISLRELLYPLMQGYDSIAIKADVELGGTDQRFNILAGREMQKQYGQNPQDIILTNLIIGTDGRKMSSSWGNTINLMENPNDMFGKVMSAGDEVIIDYFIHCTRVPMERVEEIADGIKSGMNPRDAKLDLAFEIVKIYHGEDEAQKAKEYFVNTFSKKEIPTEIIAVPSPAPEISIIDYIMEAKLAKSKSDARRKVKQGGVSVNGKKIMDVDFMLDSESCENAVIKVGKKDFVKIKF